MEDFGGSVPESRQAWGAVRLVECRFTSTETIGLLGTGAQDGHLHFHTAPDLCVSGQVRGAINSAISFSGVTSSGDKQCHFI